MLLFYDSLGGGVKKNCTSFKRDGTLNITDLDWGIIIAVLTLTMAIGLWAGKRASKNSSEFFLSGRSMPWWLLGMSMVATTFSTDTPNLVAQLTRENGVSGNWVWWAFLLTGMLTTFIYAKLWRRSGVFTDIEFYELRYSGKASAFLRGFRAVYLGFFFNVAVLASVTLAAIKFGTVLLGLTPMQTVLIAGTITVIFSSVGGFLGVLLTDFILFIIAMFGAFAAAYFSVNHSEVGGLSELISHPAVMDKMDIFPDLSDPSAYMPLLFIPLAVQWWNVWYPGAEPGGGGYIAQRMLAAKNEKHALGAVFFFNFAHYALRPWPWILVALASLIVFPDLESLRTAFPDMDPALVGHDMSYPAMLTFLPAGIMGIVVASLIAAYISTMSTGLNLGASYLVNDLYKRFINPEASEKHIVMVGRMIIVLIMVATGILAPMLESAKDAFNILLSIGAGTGLIFILRWFWWRINVWGEVMAMVMSFVVTVILMNDAFDYIDNHMKLIYTVLITTASWVATVYLTPRTSDEKLKAFYAHIHPSGPGWNYVRKLFSDNGEDVPASNTGDISVGILCMFLGSVVIYSVLFAVGSFLYGNDLTGIILSIVAFLGGFFIAKNWSKVSQ